MRPGGAEHTGLLNLRLLAEGAFPLGGEKHAGFPSELPGSSLQEAAAGRLCLVPVSCLS